MGVVKITSVYMLMGMLILISLYRKTCSIALLLVIPNLVTLLESVGSVDPKQTDGLKHFVLCSSLFDFQDLCPAEELV